MGLRIVRLLLADQLRNWRRLSTLPSSEKPRGGCEPASLHESPVSNHQPRLWVSSPCSTVMLNLEQTCNNPHPHSLARTVIRTRFIGVGLPAFLLSKNLCSESIGMPWMSQGPSGRTYSITLGDLCLPALLASVVREVVIAGWLGFPACPRPTIPLATSAK